MEAAEQLFRAGRIHEITLDEVAQQAGVGKGTIYRYFADKDDLFFQVATSGFDDLCELVRGLVSPSLSFEEQLLAIAKEIVGYFEARRELFLMMQSEDARMPSCNVSLRARWLERRKKLTVAVADILQRGIAEGILRNDMPAELMAHFLLGLLRARVMDLTEFPSDMQRVELVVAFFCTGAFAMNAPSELAGSRSHHVDAMVAN